MNTFMIMAASVLAASLAIGAAVADEGGVPNENAYTQTGNGDPQGRKGTCVPPGAVFRDTAKADGPNNDPFGTGETPGGEVNEQCDPGA